MTHDPAELRELVDRYLDDDLEPGDAERLAAALEHDDELVDYLAARAALATDIRYIENMTTPYVEPATAPPVAQLAADDQPYNIERAHSGRSFAFRYAAAAVLLMAVALGVMFLVPKDRVGDEVAVEPSVSDAPVATVTQTHDAVWADEGTASLIGPGVNLEAGSLALQLGYVELLLEQGVAVTVAGPADFKITGPNECELKRGTLLANVPPRATGFRVLTPRMQVVDLGTAFIVHVDNDGETQVHVTAGRVEASGVSADGTPLTPQSLEAGGALSSTTSAGELSPIAFTPDRFTWPSDDLQLTGGIRLLDKAPPSLAPGQRTARQPLLIRERRDVTVTEAVVKAVRASRHQIEGRLPIGTRVDVYLMHFDPGAKTESDAVSTDVSVTFPRRIVGVIDTDGGMRLTDSILGAAGTTYADRSLINLGIDEEDRLEFSGDGRTVRFIGSAYLLDQLRVLVIRD